MAHVDQPLGRGDDHLRRHVRGAVPLLHMGGRGFLLILPYFPNQAGALGDFRSPLCGGRVRHQHLPHHLAGLLYSHDPRPGDAPRPGHRLKKMIFRALSLGWNGSHRTWSRYEIVSLVLAAGDPLVSRCTASSAWTSPPRSCRLAHTIFPPYFVAGAIYSGFGMCSCCSSSRARR